MKVILIIAMVLSWIAFLCSIILLNATLNKRSQWTEFTTGSLHCIHNTVKAECFDDTIKQTVTISYGHQVTHQDWPNKQYILNTLTPEGRPKEIHLKWDR